MTKNKQIKYEENVQNVLSDDGISQIDLLNENQVGYNGPKKLAEISSSWKINYLSWKKKKNFETFII